MEGAETSQPHRNGSELFICFRPSSSTSMRAPSSRSLPSPGRNRDPAAAPSLSASLSRRLRSNGSLKGGQSPMFPAGAATAGVSRKKGCAFEAAEPSSPKVTCIGQVRVKSKKKGKGKAVMISRSQRRSGGEASFRRTAEQEKREVDGERECLPNRNQRWVYQLHISICEALKAFGSEINCFFPCGGRSLCSSSSSKEEEEKGCGGEGEKKSARTGSCGAVFARWLMAIQESEEEKRGEVVGLVVGEREKSEGGLVVGEREKREMEVVEVGKGVGLETKEEVKVEEEEEMASVCVPPRNALLLMRCRSDPVRMASLANRFWGSPGTKGQVEEAEEEEDDGDDGNEEEEDVDGQDNVEDEKEEADGEVREEEEEQEAYVQVVPAKAQQVEMKETKAQKSFEEVVVAVAVEEQGNPSEEKGEKQQRPDEDMPKGPEEESILKEGFLDEGLEVHRNPSKEEEEQEQEQEKKTLLQENAEEKEKKDTPHLQERKEEKGVEEKKGRKSSSHSFSKEKEERRSNRGKEGGLRRSCSSKEKERRRNSFSAEREAKRHSFSTERESRRGSFSIDREGRRRWSFSSEKQEVRPEEEAAAMASSAAAAKDEEKKKEERVMVDEVVRETRELERPNTTEETQVVVAEEEGEMVGEEWEEEEGEEGEEGEEEEKGRELPDCLLLMMYEPKLSMEVSKETWVCSTDFLHWQPPHPRYGHRPTHPSKAGSKGKVKLGSGDGKRGKDKKVSKVADSSMQPPPATTVEKKLVSAAAAAPAYEPFVLTRCKSEPMRSSAKLAPDACFWKSRHQPIGAGGIGF